MKKYLNLIDKFSDLVFNIILILYILTCVSMASRFTWLSQDWLNIMQFATSCYILVLVLRIENKMKEIK